MAKMQFGVLLRGQYPVGDDMVARFGELVEQARLVKKCGYDSILKNSHYAGYPMREFEQFAFLSRIVAEAPGLRAITGITLLSLHKPLHVAEMTASIDVMSGGRFTFGVGLGYRDVEFKGFGTTQKDRVPRLVENLEAIKRLWTEDHVNMKGSHFELEDASLSMKPAQQPHPPIWMGANADPAVERAAQLADAWFINPHQRMDTTARQMDIFKRARDASGRGPVAEMPMMREIFVAPTTAEAIRLARPHLEKKYKVYHEHGQDKAMPDGDNDLSLGWDELVRDRFLIGSPDEVAAEVLRYNRELGIDHLILGIHWLGMPQSLVLDGIQLFAEEVIPRVRSA